MALTGIELSAGIVVGANKPVDAKFGPYASTAAALADIGLTLRYKGLTVGIETGGQVTEYWFRDGVANSDLVEKITPLEAENIIGLSDFIIASAPGLSITTTVHTATGATDTYSVNGLASSDPAHVLVQLNGVTQTPVTDYLIDYPNGLIIFDGIPASGTQIALTALGLRTVQPPVDPTLYRYASDTSSDGLTNYYGRIANTDYTGPASASSPVWTIHRTTFDTAGRIVSTGTATAVAWANRTTATYTATT